MGLAEVERDIHTGFYTTTTGYSTNAIGIDAIQSGAVTMWEGTGSYRNAPSLASFMGRLNYEYDRRYTLTVTARRSLPAETNGDFSPQCRQDGTWAMKPFCVMSSGWMT